MSQVSLWQQRAIISADFFGISWEYGLFFWELEQCCSRTEHCLKLGFLEEGKGD